METGLSEASLFRLPRGWNKHHLFWEKRHYHRGFERMFRSSEGLVIPTPITNHDHLHARLSEPPKPNHRMMMDVQDLLKEVPEAMQHDKLWGAFTTQAYFEEQAEELRSPQEALIARRLSDSISQQIGYLSLRLNSRAT